jgi:outer membrane protein TolC
VKRLTEWDIARLSQIAYWEWVTATKINKIYETLVQNGETRNDFLVARSKKGDVANILVTENEQYVASRKGALQAAKERLLRAEYALALFYRDQDGAPILLGSDEAYEDYPEDLARFLGDLNLSSDVEELKRKRPDLMNLSLNVAKFNVDLELAKQDLRPRLDVTSEYFKRTVDNRPQMPLDYLMVMAQVSVPIERDLGNGNISAARARRTAAEKEFLLRKQTYGFEVTSLRRSLPLRLEQVAQRKIEFTKAKELVDAEILKFQTGGGNLFLVNLREETQANAEASFHEARLTFMNTLLEYQALVRTE